MGEVVSTATCRTFRAVLEATGEVVGARVLAERVSWLAALVRQMAAGVVAERWNRADLDRLDAGVGLDGRALPAKGWMAVRRLGWGAGAPVGVYVSDRVRRCAEEEATRALRLALHRRSILAAITATWPADPGRRTDAEWTALRAALKEAGGGVSSALIRNRTRQLRAYLDDHALSPADLTRQDGQADQVRRVDVVEVEGPPMVAAQVLLAAADRQLITLERIGASDARLRVQLPLCARPAIRRDWAWHVLLVPLPAQIPADARLRSPTLRVMDGRVRVDLPFTVTVPYAPATGHTVAVGFDWGVNTLLTGTVGRLHSGRVEGDGRPLIYDATPVSAKLHRLRGHREALAAKRDHYAKLQTGLHPHTARHEQVAALHERADREHARVCARIRHLNNALSWSAARWAVDQAVALGASVIYLEDLATLEARGHRRGNAALSGQVRGRVADAIRHLAAKTGLAVVTVPARGTSKYCPRCGAGSSPLHHAPAPDRLDQRGWKWAHCPRCGLSCDRDQAAAERIISRGLLAQHHTHTDRTTGVRTIRTVVEGNLSRARRPRKPTRAARRARRTRTDLHPRPHTRHDRTKTGPTPKRPTRQRPTERPTPERPTERSSTDKTFSQLPDRRLVPAPTHPVRQRPAGQAPQTDSPTAVRTGLARDPHQRTGFHKVKATPVLALAEYGSGRHHATPARSLNPSGNHRESQTL
ncbi:zinc ribbon domain-containing protein [Nonomuraea glycinis]|uniref:zinc ribbon domain-containing protein n=1 Tax=Nonomuraea glycinis TaxID=2047744 RepID=UPI002E11B33D|nr:zinc ribbon domain-containing protein [Nonomuraea glycinis]